MQNGIAERPRRQHTAKRQHHQNDQPRGGVIVLGIGHLAGHSLHDIAADDGGDAHGKARAGADDGNEQRAEHKPAQNARQMLHGKGRKRCFGRNGGMTGAHIQTHQNAARADGRNEKRADQRTPARGRRAFAAHHGLGVSLGGQNAEDERKAGAAILADAAGKETEKVHTLWIVDAVHHGLKAAEATGQMQRHIPAHEHRHIQKPQLQNAHAPRALRAAGDDIQRHEARRDDKFRHKAQFGKHHGQNRRARDELGDDVDERSHAAEAGGREIGAHAVFILDDADKRHAVR